MKLMIIVFIATESVWESSNDTGMPWIRNKCFFNQNLPHGHTEGEKEEKIINLYYFLNLEIAFHNLLLW